MYVGHLAVALAAVRPRRGAPLWVLLLASQWPDWVQLSLEALGAYNAQLYSHSLPAVLGGALLYTLIYLRQTSDARNAWIVAAVYLTHPFLDLVTGEKAWWPGGPMLGANLYDRPALDFALEASLAVAGWLIYRATFAPPSKRPRLVAVLLILIAAQALLDGGHQIRLHRADRDWASWTRSLLQSSRVPTNGDAGLR